MIVGTLVAVLALSATAIAQPGERGDRCKGKRGDHAKKIFATLDLTDTQKEQIQALHEDFKEENSDLFEQMKDLRQQAREQRQSGDKDGAAATREEMKELGEGLRAAREELHEQVKALLTEEQQAQLQEMKEKHERKRGRKGKRGDRATEGTPPNIN